MHAFLELEIEDALWRYISPFIILIGIVGNVLSFLVMSRKKLHGSVTSLYLRVLAVVDSMVLTTGLVRQWIRVLAVDIRDTSAFICKTDIFVLYWSLGSSAWILSLIAMERCVGVISPHIYKRFVTKQSAVIILITILVTLSFVYTPILVLFDLIPQGNDAQKLADMTLLNQGNTTHLPGIDIQTNNTNTTTNNDIIEITKLLEDNNTITNAIKLCQSHNMAFIYHILPHVHLFAAVLLPFLIIISCNITIISRLAFSKFKGINSKVRARSSNMTFILILVSVYFLIMTSPSNIYEMVYHQWDKKIEEWSDEFHARIDMVWAIVSLLMYMNSAGNFFLYCLSGPMFRNQLKGMFCEKSRTASTISFTKMYFTTVRNDSNEESCF